MAPTGVCWREVIQAHRTQRVPLDLALTHHSCGTTPTCFAGTPTTTAPAGTSFVTTAPAPITAPSPIVTPGRPLDLDHEPMVGGSTPGADSAVGAPDRSPEGTTRLGECPHPAEPVPTPPAAGSMAESRPTQGQRRPSRTWTVLSVVAGLFLIAFGGWVVMLGQADDSPGLGGLGLITASIGLVMLVRLLLRGRRVR